MEITIHAKNLMLDHLVSGTMYLSAHTGIPGESGILEHTTTRRLITFAPASNGQVVGNTTEDVNIAAGTTVTHLGMWDALTAGNFVASFALTNAETFANPGGIRGTDLTVRLP